MSVIDVLEAAYRLEQPPLDWLRGVVAALQPAMDGGLGVTGYFVDLSVPGRFRAWSPVPVAAPASADETAWWAWYEQTPDEAKILAHTMGPSGSASELLHSKLSSAPDELRRFATEREILGLNGIDATGLGCAVGAPQPALLPALRDTPEREVWDRIAVHLATACRIQRTLQSASIIEDAEAILDRSYRFEHAAGEARERSMREALRAAAVDADRARTRRRRGDTGEATRLWRAMVAERWTLVEHFERDGRRYLVARRNAPRPGAAAGLTDREVAVLRCAALGHSNKLIGYELGISASSVAAHLAQAASKLGVSSRVELVRAAARWLDAKGEDAPAGAREER